MAYWGCSFVFDDLATEDFSLMVYDVNGISQGQGRFGNSSTIVDQNVAAQWKPFFYGVKREQKLELSIVFGADPDRIDAGEYFKRYELESISRWLTSPSTYRYLQIIQEDMIYYRFRCMCTALELVELDNVPWALKATFTCDSPYAYLYPAEYAFEVEAGKDIGIELINESSMEEPYAPHLVVTSVDSPVSNLSITNLENGRVFSLSDLPSTANTIRVDNRLCKLECDAGLNLYDYCNFHFLTLERGRNRLVARSNTDVVLTFLCEFPVNIGS